MASLQVITELSNKIDSNPPHKYDDGDVQALADEVLKLVADKGFKHGCEGADLVETAGNLEEEAAF